MRLCAIAMVADGKLDEKEKEAIVDIANRDLRNFEGLREKVTDYLKESGVETEGRDDEDILILYIEKILTLLDADCKDSKNMRQGLFVDVASISGRQALEELRDIVYVIKADNVVTEAERMAFVSVAKVFKFSGVDKIWDTFYKMSKEDLLKAHVKYSMYDSRGKVIKVSDVEIIERTIVNYNIKGPLSYGLYSAIYRERYEAEKQKRKGNKWISMLALFTFIVSSVMVYYECAKCLEFKFIAEEHSLEFPNTVIDSLVCDGIDYLITNGTDYVLDASNELINTDTAFLQAGMDHNATNGDDKFLGLLIWSLVIIAFSILFKHFKKFLRYNHNVSLQMPSLPVILFLTLLVMYFRVSVVNLSLFYMPFFVLCMMLSIEVMIFLREKYTEESASRIKESSSGLLIVFVSAAIIADICIGIIELPMNPSGWMIFNKIAYSLFLGCLSFFAGKFMEMTALQNAVDMEKMDSCLDNIKDCLYD